MNQIQAGTDPNIPYPRHTFWFWESVNVLVPLIGILFLDWHIFTLVIFFWWELFCWGAVGALKILSSTYVKGIAGLFSRLIGLVYFVPLYLGLMLIIVSFSFTEFDTDSMLNTDPGLTVGLAVIPVNYLIEYLRSEILTGRFRQRLNMEVVMERIIYALPLACLILFAVIPLSHRFDGEQAERIIGVGIVLSKFLIDVAAHYLPGLIIQWNAAAVADEDGEEIKEESGEA